MTPTRNVITFEDILSEEQVNPDGEPLSTSELEMQAKYLLRERYPESDTTIEIQKDPKTKKIQFVGTVKLAIDAANPAEAVAIMERLSSSGEIPNTYETEEVTIRDSDAEILDISWDNDSTSTEIAERSNTPTGLEIFAAHYEKGFEEDTGAMLPGLVLMQHQTRKAMNKEAEPGRVYLQDILLPDPFHAIPWGEAIKRLRWPTKGSPEEGRPICVSSDGRGRIGVGDPGGDCETCTLKNFRDGEAPECTESRLVAVYIPEVGMVAELEFKKGGIKAYRDDIRPLIRRYGRGHTAWKVTTAQKENRSYLWFEYAFQIVARSVPEGDSDEVILNFAGYTVRANEERIRYGEFTTDRIEAISGDASRETP